MGNTCKSMADPFQCMTNPTTIKNNNNNKILKKFKKKEYVSISTNTNGAIVERH